jgi:hypothetical protein
MTIFVDKACSCFQFTINEMIASSMITRKSSTDVSYVIHVNFDIMHQRVFKAKMKEKKRKLK